MRLAINVTILFRNIPYDFGLNTPQQQIGVFVQRPEKVKVDIMQSVLPGFRITGKESVLFIVKWWS